MADGSTSIPHPRPFLKWVGGKRQLLPALLPHTPPRFGRYHEPFVGGGALFFHLRPARAALSDTNARLIRTWRGVRDHVEDVIGLLRAYPHDRGFFERLREDAVDERSDAEVAAWFIYLNRTGFNGLYRVNRNNRFNVPFGSYTNPTICDADVLRLASAALADTELHVEDFGMVLTRAEPGDFVYFDPPYVPLSATSSFTAYTAGGFGMAEQARLRDTARALKASGVHVILSNSSAPAVHELYADGFQRTPVAANRAINCDASKRGAVTELILA
ncbi:MAG: DNA adenine methylase [Pseudomonadota bacterium]|nr:DNA adenine methylase [Pseudomonadota bacterium]